MIQLTYQVHLSAGPIQAILPCADESQAARISHTLAKEFNGTRYAVEHADGRTVVHVQARRELAQ